MTEQRDLFPAQQPARQASASPQRSAPRNHVAGAPAWMSRTELLVRTGVRLYLGLLLFALPWVGFWTDNNLFTYSPVLAWIGGSGFVRGLVSGLGILNVFLALAGLRRFGKSS